MGTLAIVSEADKFSISVHGVGSLTMGSEADKFSISAYWVETLAIVSGADKFFYQCILSGNPGNCF